jgi:hypothetical protein
VSSVTHRSLAPDIWRTHSLPPYRVYVPSFPPYTCNTGPPPPQPTTHSLYADCGAPPACLPACLPACPAGATASKPACEEAEGFWFLGSSSFEVRLLGLTFTFVTVLFSAIRSGSSEFFDPNGNHVAVSDSTRMISTVSSTTKTVDLSTSSTEPMADEVRELSPLHCTAGSGRTGR